ncbi:MAG TPA: AbrB family transcriptional regulator [Usitatibacter sp.]|nr:AbrB family transcriptional regulator [Usitatibacter sp.]
MLKSSKPVRVAAGLLVCIAGGALFAALHTPLPWMMGSMLAMAAAQMAGANLEVLPGGRDAAMAVVGVSLGLYFTAPVVHQVATYWPWFVALGLAAVGFGTASALVLKQLSGTDRATAYFGSMPGGASEMAMMAEGHGAQPDLVAFAHSVRMLFVVTVFPIGITVAGFHASEEYRPILIPFDAGGLAIILGIAAVVGTIARRLRLPTAYMMGALFTSIALTVSGVTLSSVPTPLTNAAQVVLGCALGARFDRSFLTTAPRFAAALVPSITIMLTLAALVGATLAWSSGAYLGSGLLAAAPGGIAEMSITAKVLRIGVAFVTAAHVVRYLIVVLLTIPVFRLISHIRDR